MEAFASGNPAASGYISGFTVGAVIRHVRRERGESGVEELLRRVPDGGPLADLEDPGGWTPFATAMALVEAAEEVTGDEALGRHVGEELVAWADEGTSAVLRLLRSLGSPAEVFRSIAETAAKFGSALTLEVDEVGDDRAVVSARMSAALPRTHFLCEFTAGALSAVPTVFGAGVAVVDEVACERRGDPRCVYHLAWEAPEPTVGSTTAERLDAALAEVAALRGRLTSLQQTTAELVAPGDPEEVIAAITRRAGTAVRATGYLSIIRLPGDLQPRVHAWGVYPDQFDEVVRDVEARPDAETSRLVVDVASGACHYGRLVALLPAGSRFFPQERRLLETYANLAATALDTAVALEESRRQAATARELLRLSTTLARATTVEEIAARTFDALDALVECDEPAVLLWDRGYHRLVLRAARHMDRPEAVRFATEGFPVPAGPLASGLAEATTPVVIHAGTGHPAWDEMLAAADEVAAAVMPIRSGSHFHGFLSVGVTHAPERLASRDATELITGVAAQAAVALDNAHLLSSIQHLAVHDALTGLGNRRLAQERAEQALADARRTGESVAVLFVDLDGFKGVNDALGHEHGDEVLAAVAERLAGCVRETDTLARIGGDEFAVILTHLGGRDDAVCVATKLLDELRPPLRVNGRYVDVTASVGIAVAPAGPATYASLLRAADRAMYQAKTDGGGRWALSPPDDPLVAD